MLFLACQARKAVRSPLKGFDTPERHSLPNEFDFSAQFKKKQKSTIKVPFVFWWSRGESLSQASTAFGPVGSWHPPDANSTPTEFDSLHLSKRKQKETSHDASFHFLGGAEENRTPVRKALDRTFSGCRMSLSLSRAASDSQESARGSAFVCDRLRHSRRCTFTTK